MTVAPIYLVSACTSGEEFVAAFRRYADKHGLFVPIATPFASGRRGWFAVTLRDGGVMIEGEAEVVSSARTPSVLHGRIGMTLRFLEPDASSKTILGELEKARLSMRPAPPSVAPRPTAIPAEPRPVPPAAQGRIDAVNALAECVAIGAAEALDALALAPPAASPPKAGPRFVVPTIAPGVRGKSTTAPPSSSPAIAALADRGPASDTMVAVAPPAAPVGPSASPAEPPTVVNISMAMAVPRTATRQGVAPPPATNPMAWETMTVPVPRASSPTDIGGAIDPQLAAESAEPTTSPGVAPLAPSVAMVVEAAAREDASVRTQVHAGIPPREPSGMAREPAPIARSLAHAPSVQTGQGSKSDLAQTMRSPPPEMAEIRATLSTRLGMQPARRADELPPALRPSPPIVGPAPAAQVDVEIAEPTDLSMGPPMPGNDASANDVPTYPEILKPRKTSMGVAVMHGAEPSSAADDPHAETIDDRALAAADEPTGADRVLERDDDGDGALDVNARPTEVGAAVSAQLAVPDATGSEEPTGNEEPTPSEYWTIAPGGALAPTPKRTRTPSGVARFDPSSASPASGSPVVAGSAAPSGPSASRQPSGGTPIAANASPGSGRSKASSSAGSGAVQALAASSGANAADRSPGALSTGATPTARAATGPGGLPPSGDWLIALDPAAPDGWSAPFETVPAHLLADDPAAAASPPGAAPGARPRGKRPTVRPDSMPVTEPKVQVDPTLIEPLAALPPDELARTSSPDLSMYTPGFSPPGMQGAMPPAPFGAPAGFGPPPPYGPPLGFGGPNAPPAYPLDPGYQMMPVTTLPAPRASTAGGSGSGFADPRYASETALPARSRRRRIIIVLASAIVAVVVGIIVLSVFTDKHDPAPGDHNLEPRESPAQVPPGAPSTSPPAAPASPPHATTAPQPGGASPPAATDGPEPRVAAATPPPGGAAPAAAAIEQPAAAVEQPAVEAAHPPAVEAAHPPAVEAAHPPAVEAAHSPAVEAAHPPPVEAAHPSVTQAALPVAAAAVTMPTKTLGGETPAAGACYADVASVPSGAEIVVGDSNVVGMTPQKITLPCGKQVDLTIRKGRLVSATRAIKPSPEGAIVRVTLGKQTFLVKVSSTPMGATITLNGKSLGVTPTTIKIPAFEQSTLILTKEGYATDSAKVSPKSAGVAVHSALKKLERRPR